ISRIHDSRTTLGGSMDPHAAGLPFGGIKILGVGGQGRNENALRLAQYLANHSRLKLVNYPFLEGNPQRNLAVQQLAGGGGLRSFEVDANAEDVRRFVESLTLFALAPSLGGVDSLVTIPVLTSHAMISAEDRHNMGVADQLVRISVGIEHADDLIADLGRGLAEVVSSAQSAELVRG